ncbi:MAG: hypothetical protein PHF67_03125 [Candidatus Nanoarchaeia archaeon]|nr:hypothetical protein [Candidatus Nanoarchaeia archaeon]
MVLKRLFKGLEKLCLVGALALGFSGETNSEEFARPNENVLKMGYSIDNESWTYGPKFNGNGPYAEIGRGFGDVTGYLEAGVQLPVINAGFIQPEHSENFADISPNCFVPRIGIGARTKFYENQDSGLSFCGDLKVSRLSEFADSVVWPDKSVSIFEVHGITSIDAKLWFEQPFSLADRELRLNLGAIVGFDYAAGDAFTYTTDSNGKITDRFSLINQRNKARAQAIVGFDYIMDNGWTLNTTARVGSGTGINMGFSRKLGK